MPVAVAKQLRGDRVPVGSRTLEHFAQTAKVTGHAPRGRDTSRNSLVPLGASESPRLALGPAVSVPRYLAPHDRAWQAGSLARKVVPGNFTTGLVSSRYLGFGVSQMPRRHRQLAFPPIPTGTPSRLTALARLGSLLRSVRPPGTDFEPNVVPSDGSNALDQHICPLTCASVATERVTRPTIALRCPGRPRGLSRQLTERPHHSAPRVRVHRQLVDDVCPALPVPIVVAHQQRGDRVAIPPG